jgi:aspartyl aminopeptidase
MLFLHAMFTWVNNKHLPFSSCLDREEIKENNSSKISSEIYKNFVLNIIAATSKAKAKDLRALTYMAYKSSMNEIYMYIVTR